MAGGDGSERIAKGDAVMGGERGALRGVVLATAASPEWLLAHPAGRMRRQKRPSQELCNKMGSFSLDLHGCGGRRGRRWRGTADQVAATTDQRRRA
jgi:hypothetical protein